MLSALVSILVLFPLTQNILSPNTPAQNTLAPNALGQNASTQKALAPNASVQSALDTTRLPQPVFAENPGLFEPRIIWECDIPSADKPALGKQGQIVRKDFCGWSALGPISLFIENVLGIRSVDAEKLTVDWDIHHKCLHGVRNLRFGPCTGRQQMALASYSINY
jgi:hypothetical protein